MRTKRHRLEEVQHEGTYTIVCQIHAGMTHQADGVLAASRARHAASAGPRGAPPSFRRRTASPRATARAGARRPGPPSHVRAEHHPEDPRRRRQARPRRARPRREDHRPRAARRRHGGHLHGPAPDARADRRDGHPGGRRRRRAVDPLGRPHDARPARSSSCCASRASTTCWSPSAARSRPTTSPSSSGSAWPRCSRPGASTQDIIDFIQGAVRRRGAR